MGDPPAKLTNAPLASARTFVALGARTSILPIQSRFLLDRSVTGSLVGILMVCDPPASNPGTPVGNYTGVTVTVTINGVTQSINNLSINVQ